MKTRRSENDINNNRIGDNEMSDQSFDPPMVRRSCPKPGWVMILCGAMLANSATAAPRDSLSMVRDVASRVGPIIGSALACASIAPSRVQLIIDKFQTVIRGASPSDAVRADVERSLDRYIADGRSAVATGRTDCRLVDQQIADLTQQLAAASNANAGMSLTDAIAPSTANATIALNQPIPQSDVRAVTGQEIRFGIVIPFSGSTKEFGHNIKLGIQLAFARANDTGGVNGRTLNLIPADDGFEPSRTLDAMKTLWEKEQVFGFIGNLGTPTAEVAVPYALERRALFFAPLTGANVVRHDPPDRYVFNYRPSYVEEADAAVRYLLKIRKLQPRQIAVFGQNDSYGDAGFAGVARAFRTLGINDSAILRLNYKRNTVDVDEAVNQLKLQKVPIRAVVMAATARPAAKFIEKTRDLLPGMIYANLSPVDASSLAGELLLLGPRFTQGVIVTQTVPAVSGYSNVVLGYRNALAKYFPGESPDSISLESFISANILIDALKRCGPQIDTERLVDILENTRNIDMGLGATLGFSSSEHQASHKVWGTALDETGKYQPIELE